MATTITRPPVEQKELEPQVKAPPRISGWIWAVVALILAGTALAVAYLMGPAETESVVALDWAGSYYWEEITSEAVALAGPVTLGDTFYVDGLEVRAAEARAAQLAVALGPTGYYWEELNRQALARLGSTPADTFYVAGLEVRAAEARAAALAEALGQTGYYWEEINRQALERIAPSPTPAERLLEELSG